MPLLYGEGHKAFFRLQEEIMKTSDDNSLFVWANVDSDSDHSAHGLLADSPAWFNHCAPVDRDHTAVEEELDPYTMTNKGLRIQLKLRILADGICMAILNCNSREFPGSSGSHAIYLKHLRAGKTGKSQSARVFCDRITWVVNAEPDLVETLFVRQSIDYVGWEKEQMMSRAIRVQGIAPST